MYLQGKAVMFVSIQAPESPESLQVVISLSWREVGAEAVAGIVQAEERLGGRGGEEERSQRVKTAGIVQPAVEGDPVSEGL